MAALSTVVTLCHLMRRPLELAVISFIAADLNCAGPSTKSRTQSRGRLAGQKQRKWLFDGPPKGREITFVRSVYAGDAAEFRSAHTRGRHQRTRRRHGGELRATSC